MDSIITIIVPIYNASLYLRDCLDSIIRQTYTDWTCILVNDGSTDSSQSIIDEYCALDSRFVGVIKQNERSPYKTRLYGLKYVKTEFVLMIDADDLVSDNYVEMMVKRQYETNADIVLSRMCCFENGTGNIVWYLPDYQFDLSQITDGKQACLLTIPNWLISLNGSLKRKNYYDGLVSLTEGNWANLDEIIGRELLIRCQRVAFSDASYYYRENQSSITRGISPILFDMSINDAYLVKFARKYYPDNKSLMDELAHKHFSRLRQSIIDFEKIKGKFSRDECHRVEMALAWSYKLMDLGLLLKRSLKWGIIVVLLRKFSWFKHFVVTLNRKV